jgi:hypothetical protein
VVVVVEVVKTDFKLALMFRELRALAAVELVVLA